MKTTRTYTTTRAIAFSLLATYPIPAAAEDESTKFVEPNVFDQIWGFTTLYKDDMNPYLQEFKLRGRYQGQYWDVDADQGSQSHWEDRHSRFGFDAKLFEKKIELRADFQSNDQLKLMAGIEWSWLNNDVGDSFDGYTLLSGIRLSF